jgi:surfeit locus 1 family protein
MFFPIVAIPVTAFALGTWQVKRLEWKTNLIAKYEDRLVRPPLPLPPIVNTERIDEFDYRRVLVSGKFRHDQEMLVGPRIREGHNGYQVVTPLERTDGTTVLVNRGWINKKKKEHKDRRDALPEGQVTVEGLLRSPWKKNMFTPANRVDLNEFYFPDVEGMARLVGAQPVWIEQIMGSQHPVSRYASWKGR